MGAVSTSESISGRQTGTQYLIDPYSLRTSWLLACFCTACHHFNIQLP